MTKLKLTTIDDDKPVRVTVEIPASLNRDLAAYAEAMARENGTAAIEPHKLIAPMLARFIASDRGFASVRHQKRGRA